jgi:hypothetical protein
MAVKVFWFELICMAATPGLKWERQFFAAGPKDKCTAQHLGKL